MQVEIENNSDSLEPISIEIPIEYTDTRIDAVLAELIPDLSRTRLVTWLKAGQIIINGEILKPKYRVIGGEHVVITPMLGEEKMTFKPEKIDIPAIYEDEHIIVINKPAGLTVHPGNGNWNGTLLNGLLFRYPELINLPRAGIVHRLDKDTSGLMVVARTLLAQTKLVQDLQSRKVDRIYRAIVEGHPHKEGIVNKNIGRDPKNRIKMTTLSVGGKEALTRFKVLKYFDKFSYIECKLETGRTHQIRVHMRSISHPIIGDQLYGHKKINYQIHIVDAIESLNRQALHAIKLSFNHPATGELMQFKSALAHDIRYLLQQLMLDTKEAINELNDEDDSDSNWEVFYVN